MVPWFLSRGLTFRAAVQALGDFRDRATGEQSALFDDADRGADVGKLGQDVRRQEDRFVCLTEAQEQVAHLDARVEGNVGFDAGTYSETAGPSGTEMTLTGKYLVVLKRGADGWKAAYVIYNFDGPPPPCGQ